jgi:hypothetical protein
MKNLVVKFITFLILMSLSFSAFALAEGVVDESAVAEKASACQAAVVKKDEQGNEILNEAGLQTKYDELISRIDLYEQQENKEIGHAYIATVCANKAKSDLAVRTPSEGESINCIDPKNEEVLPEAAEGESGPNKRLAASNFCLNKAYFDVQDEIWAKAQPMVQETEQVIAITQQGNLSVETFQGVGGSVAVQLQELSNKLLAEINATGFGVDESMGNYCRNIFYGAGEYSKASDVADKENYNDYFKAFVEAYKQNGVASLQKNLHVKRASQCTNSPLVIGDERIEAPLGIPGVENTYQQSLFVYASDSKFAGDLSSENPGGLKKRLCIDHARQYCAPMVNFYVNCTKMPTEGNAKKACKAIAYKSFLDCSQQLNNASLWNYEVHAATFANSPMQYEQVFTLDDGGQSTNPSENVSVEDYIDSVETQLKDDPSQMVKLGAGYVSFYSDLDNANTIQSQHSKSVKEKFHDYYGICSVYREASKKNINDDTNAVPVGDKVSSVNGRHACSLSTPWTADYKFCHYSILWADGFSDILSVAGATGTAIHGQIAMEGAMNNANVQAMEGDQTAGMEVQIQELKNRSTQHWVNAGIDTATAVGAMSAWMAYPTPKRLRKACKGEVDNPVYRTQAVDCGMYHAYTYNWIEGGGRADSDASVYPNAKIKQVMMMKMIQKFGSGLMNGIMAREYDKQVGMLEQFREGVQDFYEDPEVNFPTDPAEQASYCQRYPTIPSCKSGGRRDQGVQGGINFAGGQQGGQGGSFSFGNDGAGEFFVNEDIDASEKKAIADLKGVIGNTKRNKFGDDFNAPGAGKGSMSGGSGGGSISGSAKGGAGGGAGGGGGTGGGGPTGQAGPKKVSAKFNAGTADTFKFKGGGTDSKNSKSKNPFASLVGKKNRKVASQVVDDIGDKKSKLFEKISNAYSKAKKANRLIIINE